MTTERTHLDPFAARVLRAMFELAQLDRPAHAGLIAQVLGTSSTRVAGALLALDRLSLADAERARVSLRGLAVAARLPALGLELSLGPSPRTRPNKLRGLVKVLEARGELLEPPLHQPRSLQH